MSYLKYWQFWMLLTLNYLNMWFRRIWIWTGYARFKSHGRPEEIFWMGRNVAKQKSQSHLSEKAVWNYSRIQHYPRPHQLTSNSTKKLEETARRFIGSGLWSFEFPPDENGKPYKSNGGEMVWMRNLQKEIPKGGEWEKLEEINKRFKFVSHL